MQDIPKIVASRLQQSAVEGPHPDANVLTGFAERSLVDSERSQVKEHLAHCSECREIVAFALPEPENILVNAPTEPVRRGWLSLGVLQWGVVAAGILAVASVGIMQYRHRDSRTWPPAATMTARNDMPSATRSQPRSADSGAEKTSTTANSERHTPMSELANNSDISADKSDRSTPTTSPMVHAHRLSAHSPSPVSKTESSITRGTAAQNLGTQNETAQNEVSDQLLQRQGSLSSQNKPSTNSDVVKAKAPLPSEAVAVEASAPTLDAQTGSPETGSAAKQALQASSSIWIVSPAGTLRRSLDSGKTWEDVNVAEGLDATQKNAQTAAALSKQLFSVVTSIGADVWAGGSGSTLYHSADFGERWTRVLPLSTTAILTGDITRIEFTDQQHGTILTSTGESWITADAGQSWRLRQ